jgi:hypothetical protein
VSDGKRPASGVPARNYSWPPFEPGNTAAVRHGCYSPLTLAPRAEEIAVLIRSQLDPADASRFDLLIATSAALGAQSERALLALDAAEDPVAFERLGRDARGWVKLWLSALKALNLTPALATQASRDAGGRRLHEHLEAVYGSTDEGEADA